MNARSSESDGSRVRRFLSRDRSVPAIALLSTHGWRNIGDLALNYNEVALLERLHPEARVYPITRAELASDWARIVEGMTPDVVIAIHGGGNLGDLWPHEEAARQAIVETFPAHRLLVLPQSIHFDDRRLLEDAMRRYDAHPDLLLCVRDERSGDLAEGLLHRTRVERTTDVALRHTYPFPFRPAREGVLFVRRDDKEKDADAGIDRAYAHAVDVGIPTAEADTIAPGEGAVGTEAAGRIVYDTIDEFRTYRAVVTDRLHGAVFALIAGTPVLVYENSYRKIRPALKRLLPALAPQLIFAADAGSTGDAIAAVAAAQATALRPLDVLAEEHRRFDSVVRAFTRR